MNKVAFVRGSGSPYDETMSGFGGTQLCVLDIAKELTKSYDVYVVHHERERDFIGDSGIKYVNNIDEKTFHAIIDIRFVRKNFIDNVKYIHWIHDPHHYNQDRMNPGLQRYHHVISLTDIQTSLWNNTNDINNFEIINNPFVLEPIEKKKYDRYKIVAFSSKTLWGKCIRIVEELRKVDERFTLHVCSPSYSDISNMMKEYDFIVNHGSLSHRKTMELLSDAFVCLYPTHFQESFGCVCYECMYYGVPMLTEYVHGSGTSEIIPPPLLFPGNCDINMYINTILEWIKNDNRPDIHWEHRNDEIYNSWNTLLKSVV